jgi:hypothetical protein
MVHTVNNNGGGVGLGVVGVDHGGGVNGLGPSGKEVEERLRVQAGVVLHGLAGLRERVGEVEGRVERQRWRRWVVGGLV